MRCINKINDESRSRYFADRIVVPLKKLLKCYLLKLVIEGHTKRLIAINFECEKFLVKVESNIKVICRIIDFGVDICW